MPNGENPKNDFWEHVADGVLKAVALYGVGFYIMSAGIAVLSCDAEAGISSYIVMAVGMSLQLLGTAVLFFRLFGDNLFFDQKQRLKYCLKVVGFFLLIFPIMFALYDVLATWAFFSQFNNCNSFPPQ